jgi:curved DNA-binding protein CbpA
MAGLWFSHQKRKLRRGYQVNVHSHYENLKVSRDAPPEVIRAAYKALSMLWHPDRSSDARAPDIMRTINIAYDTLSDPIKRHAHDQWIEAKELEWTLQHPTIVRAAPQPEPVKPVAVPAKRGRAFEIDDWLFTQAVRRTDKRLPTTIGHKLAWLASGAMALSVVAVISH